MAKLEKLEVPNDDILTEARIQLITVQTLDKSKIKLEMISGLVTREEYTIRI